jgi:hypothetical protein
MPFGSFNFWVRGVGGEDEQQYIPGEWCDIPHESAACSVAAPAGGGGTSGSAALAQPAGLLHIQHVFRFRIQPGQWIRIREGQKLPIKI